MSSPIAYHQIFDTPTADNFAERCLAVFRYQARNNPVYSQYISYLGVDYASVKHWQDIPFMPISFFKSHHVQCGSQQPQIVFSSSGTTGAVTSKHPVVNLEWYHQSFRLAFEQYMGKPTDLCILALLPGYLERTGSSLVYMVDNLIAQSQHPQSGFYLNNLQKLVDTLTQLERTGQKALLIGVSFALMDLAERFPIKLKNTLVMETGGMKGRRKELTRTELHGYLMSGFGTHRICSEYGMTELLSQAYSMGKGAFYTPHWMRLVIRDPQDPFCYLPQGRTGGINIIDLANVESCSFIETQDLGRLLPDGGFEIMGRFDHSDIRGCNLMVANG